MRRAILVAVVLTSIWSEQATAIDGNKLFEHCEFFSTARLPPHPLDASKGGYCIGYIVGVHDALVSKGNFCVPDGVTGGQLGDVVKLYLRNHPEGRHLSADELVTAALKEKFPCN
jgi:hypothetical protein